MVKSCLTSFVAPVFGISLVVLLPYIHIGIIHLKLWVPDKLPVNKTGCHCSCFDTVFKGTYQGQNARIGYKHVYFNATYQTFCIWLITVITFIVTYELFKYLWKLFVRGKLRKSMLFLVLLDIYPHYFTWWIYFNYFNDDFYDQFFHQIFFSTTEFISTVVIVTLCSLNHEVTKRKVMVIICISVIHIVIGGFDQFFAQFFLREGRLSQKLRSLGLAFPDVLRVVVPIYVYKKSKIQIENDNKSLFTVMDIVQGTCAILLGVIFGKVVL